MRVVFDTNTVISALLFRGVAWHQVFKKPGEPEQLNFQNRNGCIPPYQARQLLAMMRKYEVEK